MIRIVIANKAGRSEIEHPSGPIELGRGPQRECPRQVIADRYLSNNQLRVEEVDGDQVRLENLSQRLAVQVAGGPPLKPGETRVVGLPARLTAGASVIDVERPPTEVEVDKSTLRTIEATSFLRGDTTIARLASLAEAPGAEQLARWFEAVIALQRSAASSPDFYDETARAVVDLIGLDYGLVLLREAKDWKVVARHGTNPIQGSEFSRTILRFASVARKTFYQVLYGNSLTSSQLQGSAIVAAPFRDNQDQVVGAVYGVRGPRPDEKDVSIRALEAQLVQVLAATVAVGLARLESEDRAARQHRQFTDFFSPELARELDRKPDLLDGERRELTILFSDIRGFSRISEQLSPEETCALVRDVMECLTRRIREHRGVVIDYIGDAILALWNAPADQPDHATLACHAALAMMEEVPGLESRWGKKIGGVFGLGVGLNTGTALVGNTGSLTRFKYGPLGHAVNLASRVEGATKQLGVSLLITGSTHAALGEHDLATRRLCRAEVAGIAGSVDLYELHARSADPAWRKSRDTYEAGLRLFEANEMAEACRMLYGLLEGRRGHYDLPTLSLVGRAIEHLRDPLRPFNPVVRLDAK